MYTRRMSEAMTRWLVWLYFKWYETAEGWDETPHAFLRVRFGGDYTKLKYWGFVENKTNEDETKTHSGIWRITQWGRKFVDGTMAAPAYLRVLNDEKVGFSDANVLFYQLYGVEFDIRDVMGKGP